MPAPSLKHLATATAIKHVKSLTDIGNLPYTLVRPILMKVDNPEKLHTMELLSPQLAEEDQEIWLELIKRDIPRWNTYDLPKHTNRWYEIYCDLHAEVQRELDADAAKMKMAIDGIKSERAQLQPKVMNQLPRGVRASRPRIASRGVYIPRSGHTAPEAKKKAAIFAPQRRNAALAVPTKHLSTRATQIKKAPRSLIEEHRRPVEQSVPRRDNQNTTSGRLPLLGRAVSASSSSSARPASDLRVSSSLAEREARLKAIAAGKPLPSSSATASASTTPTNTHNSHDPPASTKEAPSPAKRAIPKRRATSPPPQTQSQSLSHSLGLDDSPASRADNAGPEPSTRPVISRKRTEVDIFLRPKKRRVV